MEIKKLQYSSLSAQESQLSFIIAKHMVTKRFIDIPKLPEGSLLADSANEFSESLKFLLSEFADSVDSCVQFLP